MVYLNLLWVLPMGWFLAMGVYLSARWTANGELDSKNGFGAVVLFILFVLLWPFLFERDDKKYLKPTPAAIKSLNRETKRMTKELEVENAAVELLELRASHRQLMDELNARRQKIEEDETQRITSA